MALDEVDKLEQMVKAKSIPLSENASYEWYDWLISHIPSLWKSLQAMSRKIITELFETKLDNNTSKDHKPKKTADTFNDK